MHDSNRKHPRCVLIPGPGRDGRAAKRFLSASAAENRIRRESAENKRKEALNVQSLAEMAVRDELTPEEYSYLLDVASKHIKLDEVSARCDAANKTLRDVQRSNNSSFSSSSSNDSKEPLSRSLARAESPTPTDASWTAVDEPNDKQSSRLAGILQPCKIPAQRLLFKGLGIP